MGLLLPMIPERTRLGSFHARAGDASVQPSDESSQTFPDPPPRHPTISFSKRNDKSRNGTALCFMTVSIFLHRKSAFVLSARRLARKG